jgi:sulfonate dioxygenase
LSPTFQSFIDNLKAVHTSAKMIAHARLTGSLVRKDPVESVHPLVRVHPVTGEKCLFINGEFITKIEGLKEPEFRVLQDFLMQHLITGHDFQARVRWQPRTVVMFDNRSTIRKFLPLELNAALSNIKQIPPSSITSMKTTAQNHATSSASAL